VDPVTTRPRAAILKEESMKREFVVKWKTMTRGELDDILDEVFAKIQVRQLIKRVSNDHVH